jgi:hypothetical protein
VAWQAAMPRMEPTSITFLIHSGALRLQRVSEFLSIKLEGQCYEQAAICAVPVYKQADIKRNKNIHKYTHMSVCSVNVSGMHVHIKTFTRA